MTLTIAPNGFTQPDFDVFYTAPDGRKLTVGRIFRASAGTARERPWFWSVEFHQRAGRSPPHQGYIADEETAKREWKRCWESADVPIQWAASAPVLSKYRPLVIIRPNQFASFWTDQVNSLTRQTRNRRWPILITIRIVGYPARNVLASNGATIENSGHSAQ
jgi:hypothetical protein